MKYLSFGILSFCDVAMIPRGVKEVLNERIIYIAHNYVTVICHKFHLYLDICKRNLLNGQSVFRSVYHVLLGILGDFGMSEPDRLFYYCIFSFTEL